VVLIREGLEVGEPANPYDVGTLVQINASVRLEDGRMLIATIGQRRFRIQYVLQSFPYMVASVAMLPEESGAGLFQMSERLREIYDEYWRVVAQATGMQPEVEALPQDVVAMSYHLAHRMQVPNERKQHWLETTVAARMREITSALQAEIDLLPRGGGGPLGTSNIPWSWN
jgi:Lon protease-like protein